MPDISEVIFEVKNKQAIADINKMKKSLDSTSKSAQGLITILASGWTTAKLLNAVGEVAKKFEDVKVTAGTFNRIFKDSLDTANAGVKDLIDNFNETERSAQKLLNTIGGRLSNLGLNPQELSQYTTELAKITQELTAAGMGTGLEENAKKLSQSLMGEVGGLKDLGIFINTNTQAFKQQVKAIAEAKGITEQLAKAHLIYSEIIKQTTQYTGTFASKSGDLKQALDDIKNTVDSGIFAEMGKTLNLILTPFLQIINRFLSLDIVKKFGGWALAIGTITVPIILIKKAIGTLADKAFVKLKVAGTSAYASIKQQASIANRILSEMHRLTTNIVDDTLNIGKAWALAAKEQKKALKEQKEQAEFNKKVQAMYNHSSTLYHTGKFSPFSQWYNSKLDSEDFKSINDKAKYVSTAFLNSIAATMQSSSSAWASNFGDVLYNIFNSGFIPVLNTVFVRSKILSGAFVGISESIKFLVQNLIKSRIEFNVAEANWRVALTAFSKNLLTQFKLIFTSLTAALKTFSFNVKYTTAQLIASLGLTNATKKIGAKLQSGFATMFLGIGLFLQNSIAKLGTTIVTALKGLLSLVTGVAAGIFSATSAIALAAGFTLAAVYDVLFGDGQRSLRYSSKVIRVVGRY